MVDLHVLTAHDEVCIGVIDLGELGADIIEDDSDELGSTNEIWSPVIQLVHTLLVFQFVLTHVSVVVPSLNSLSYRFFISSL